ncbi:MAG: hypothetical protein WC227_03890 [Patescibacteria group bacterium]|jgi:hypothetical protein
MPKEEKEKKPVWKKWWFWVIVVIVIICLIPKGSIEKATNSLDSTNDKLKGTSDQIQTELKK